MAPSLLTWPTIKTGTSIDLARLMSSWVRSRAWVTLPEEELSADRFIV